MTPLMGFLLVAALLFAIGLAGALTRRNAILVLIGIELMLNAANLNLIAFWRYGPHPEALTGMMFAIFSIAVAAAEAFDYTWEQAWKARLLHLEDCSSGVAKLKQLIANFEDDRSGKAGISQTITAMGEAINCGVNEIVSCINLSPLHPVHHV